MLDAQRRAGLLPGGAPIALYKNNTDNKGASYGAHENYLMRRSTPFADIVKHLTPFFVSRQVITGAGRVGIGQDGREHGFQVSQRADFFEVEVGLETTLKRPIINTRDEPHADPEKYRRLHVIIGDANLAEVSTYLKVGTTALVLAMIEDRFITADLTVDGPVAALRAISHDPTLRSTVTLTDGRKLTGDPAPAGVPRPGPQVRRGPVRRRRRRPDRRRPGALGVGARPARARPDAVRRASSTGSPSSSCSSSTASATGSTGTTPSSQLIDLQYSDIRPEKGLYHRLVAGGRIERLLDDASIEARHARPARGHPRLLPRPLPREVRRARRRRILGLRDLRPARTRVAAAGADDRPAARQQGPRR